MEELDFVFTLYAVDQRLTTEFKDFLQQCLGCSFAPEQADRPSDELEGCFEAETLGIYISLRAARPWPEGSVYRITGSTARRLFVPGAREVDLEPHLARLLQRAGVQKVLSRGEFVARNRELFPELYRETAS